MSDENIIKRVGRKLFLMKADFIKNHLVKNKDISIIVNNCIGADISHSLNLHLNSVTVNLQILPYYFPRFVKRLEYYMGFDIEELTDVDEEMDAQIYRVYHRYAKDLNFPLGMCGDIPVCFQHFHSFEEAREAWNCRKKRIDYHNIGYIFIEEEEFKSEMEEFDTINVEKKIVFTINFDLKLANTKVIRVDIPPDTHFMETAGHMKKYYEKNFCAYKWVNQRV